MWQEGAQVVVPTADQRTRQAGNLLRGNQRLTRCRRLCDLLYVWQAALHLLLAPCILSRCRAACQEGAQVVVPTADQRTRQAGNLLRGNQHLTRCRRLCDLLYVWQAALHLLRMQGARISCTASR